MNDSPPPVFRLARGATGFRRAADAPLPEVDVRVCRTAWHAAARAARGQVGDFAERRYPRNFHLAALDAADGDGPHVALFHAHHPLLAFVAGRRHSPADEFRDPPRWASVLDDFGFTVLTAALLRSPLSAADVSALSASEREQIRYWRPETVGAALFNAWD